MGRLILVAAVAVAGFLTWKNLLAPRYVPQTEFTDIQGNAYRFSRGYMRPAVIGFWISPCGYSDRVLKILEETRAQFSPESLDVFGFYVNATSQSQLVQLASEKKLSLSVVEAQQRMDLIANLHNGFKLRGAGVDVYVVDASGRIHTIDAGSKGVTGATIRAQVRNVLTNRVPSAVSN